MSSKRPAETWLDYRKRLMDPVSASFCGAKWLNATIWLGHGATASCHLPPAHKIDVAELADNPSAIHNTGFKKKMRKLMLEGHRPRECDYCWKLEDMGTDAMSDRMFKTAQFGEASLTKVATAPWDMDSPLETLEIAFNRTCQFACSYCNAGFSTTWAKDINEHGAYQNLITEGAGAFQHNGAWAEPYGKANEGNPYVAAFWQWWPELSKTLKQLRVTGGEPLMSPDVWKLMEFFKTNPSSMSLAINSNLGAKDELIDRLIENSHHIPHFEIFTSNEATDAQAEYIRDGLDFDRWVANVEKIMTHGKVDGFHMMMTINALCLFSLGDFLDLIVAWRTRFGPKSPRISANILRFPSFMSPLVLPPHIREDLAGLLAMWIKANGHALLPFEVDHLQRVVDYIKVVETPHELAASADRLACDFKAFHKQYDLRRGKSITVFPKVLLDWLDTVPDTNLGRVQPLISGDPTA